MYGLSISANVISVFVDAFSIISSLYNNQLYTLSKKLCQLIFCSVLIKYESISIKIGRHVLEETANKTVHTAPVKCASTTLRNLK